MGRAPLTREKRVSQDVMVGKGHRDHQVCPARGERMATGVRMERRVKKVVLDPKATREQWV